MTAKPTSTHPYLAGAATVDITPALGIQLAGDIGRVRPTEEIRERLYAHALVLEQGGQRFCIVVLDLLSSSQIWVNQIRQRASQRFNLDPGAIMVHVTQNHAAPALGHFFVSDGSKWMPEDLSWLKGGDDAYHQPTADKIVEAIGKAAGSLAPATLSFGRAIDGRWAFNRRFVLRDGKGRCHPPGCDPLILHVEGPADPEVSVLLVKGADDKPIAVLTHFTSHPCHGYPHRYVIGDWPGVLAGEMKSRLGGGCVSMIINGCCGNIHHANHIDPEHSSDPVRMGKGLADSAMRAMQKMQPLGDARLAWRHHVEPVKYRPIPKDSLAAARKMLAENPRPIWLDPEKTRASWDWVYATGVLDVNDLKRAKPTFDYEIQALRLGDFSLLALMGEPFVEAQLKIKLEAPTRQTMVAHFCNGYVGYLPTKQAFKHGGYETRQGAGSKLVVGALDQITRAGQRMLRELY